VLQRVHFRKQTEQRAGVLETAEEHEYMKLLGSEIAARRHHVTFRAVSLVEQRADDFVRDQLGQLASIDTTLDVAGRVRERLSATATARPVPR